MAFLVGSAAGAAGCAAVAFFGMFYGLRLVCWIAGRDDYMFYMFFAMGAVPAAALGGLACGGFLAVTLFKNRLDRQGFLHFEAVSHPTKPDAG